MRIWAQALPVDAATGVAAQAAGADPIAWALNGGEDYELCFTAPPDKVEQASQAVVEETGTTVTAVGEILLPEEGRGLAGADGREIPLEAEGWEHLWGQSPQCLRWGTGRDISGWKSS